MSTSHLNVPYLDATSPRQVMDIYLPSDCSDQLPLLVYVHGGAWRSDSKDDLTPTLMPFLLQFCRLPIANLEYRLAPTDPHPAQVLDIISALSLLSDPAHRFDFEGVEPRWNRSRIYFIGHSAGAFMGVSILLRSPLLSPPLFSVAEAVRKSIRGIICVDGIFDLVDLLDEYPTYAYFIEEAFGKEPAAYESESPARWELDGVDQAYLRFLVLHSKEDELLSLRQPRFFLSRLSKLLGTMEVTEEAEEDGRLLEGKAGSIEVDFETIKGKHEALPHTEVLARRIAVWIQSKEQ